jgi:hypothetical protein
MSQFLVSFVSCAYIQNLQNSAHRTSSEITNTQNQFKQVLRNVENPNAILHQSLKPNKPGTHNETSIPKIVTNLGNRNATLHQSLNPNQNPHLIQQAYSKSPQM